MLNLTDIQYVVTVAQERSFTKASNKLFVSQSAISQSVSKVESEYNVQLFVRGGKNIEQTPACATFVETGKQILELYDKLDADMKRSKEEKQDRLRIGTVSFFNKVLKFHDQISKLKESELSGIKFEIYEDSASIVESMTARGELDFCFTRKPLLQKSLEYEPLFKEEIFLIVPEEAEVPCPGQQGRYPRVSLECFREMPFVMITNPRIMPVCMNLCAEAHFSPNIVYQTGTWEHVYTGVQQLHAVGFISSFHIHKEQSVRYFRIASEGNMLEHVVAYPSRERISETARLYITSIREHMNTTYPPLD